MKKNKKIFDADSAEKQVVNSILESVVNLIKKCFNLQHVQINLEGYSPNIVQDGEMIIMTVLKRDKTILGSILTTDSSFISLKGKEKIILENIAEMLIVQLDSLSAFENSIGASIDLVKENSRFKTELDLAYEDLNMAHEELNDAYNLGIILNRNLSKMRQEMKTFLEQAPVAFGILRHRRLKIEVANSLILKLWGKNQSVIGMPLSVALPELAGQGYLDILDEVYTSGNRFVGSNSPVKLEIKGVSEIVFFNFIYEPLKNESAVTNGIMIIATDATPLAKEN